MCARRQDDQGLTWRGMFFIMEGERVCCGSSRRVLWLQGTQYTVLQALEPIQIPSFRQIASLRVFWGTAIGLFAGNYTWFIFLNWLPYYFETQRHYTRAIVWP